MPRFDDELYFFENSSEKRDVASWWKPIQEKVLSWGIQVTGLVSDRAKALVKLGESAYLQVVSMPDLFHYTQDFGKLIGLQIGKRRAQLLKAYEKAKESEKVPLKEELAEINEGYDEYRQQMQQINKTVHPFNEQDQWQSQQEVEKSLLKCFTAIGQLGPKLGIEISVAKAAKIFHQITPIAKGVAAWVTMAQLQVEQWVSNQLISEQEKEWFVTCALPYTYWQIQLSKTKAKFRNQDLRAAYQQRLKNAKQRAINNELITQIEPHRQEELLLMAHQLAISFQRASSQTEGRNGYLAFINHAHRGIPEERLEALTIIHNYDIRRKDNSTPAQRLFGREFPDLFEFLCQNVTGFKEPRQRNSKCLNINILQR
ncbi:MAG: DUF6399 domain-containing protein [Saprospiraceae bacterium]